MKWFQQRSNEEAGLTLVTGPYKIDPTDPNLFAIITGDSAKGRKGTSLRLF
jgi:hypothetical protein